MPLESTFAVVKVWSYSVKENGSVTGCCAIVRVIAGVGVAWHDAASYLVTDVIRCNVGVPVAVAVAVAVAVEVGVGVSVAVAVGVGVNVAVAVGVGVKVAVAVAVGVGVDVAVAVGVGVGLGQATPTNASPRLSFGPFMNADRVLTPVAISIVNKSLLMSEPYSWPFVGL